MYASFQDIYCHYTLDAVFVSETQRQRALQGLVILIDRTKQKGTGRDIYIYIEKHIYQEEVRAGESGRGQTIGSKRRLK